MIADPAFFADWSALLHRDYLRCTYHLRPDGDAREAAASLCAESSTAMWKRTDVTEDLRARHGAKVLAVYPLPDAPGLYHVEIAHPHRNFGPRLPNLLSAIVGEGVFYAPGVRSVKLMDIDFPPDFLGAFPGPRFGIAGLREQLGIVDRPLFIGIVKPNLGLAPEDFAALGEAMWDGGVDICKDDEMQADAEWSPLLRRVQLMTAARRRAETRTGERKGFLANITDEVDRMPRLARSAEAAGANLLMCNTIWTGFSAVRVLRETVTVPLMGHFTGAAILSRRPDFGIASALICKLSRLVGCDLIVFAGAAARMQTSDREVRENVRACLDPLGNMPAALPMPGGSNWAATLQTVYEQVGHPNFGFIVGRGVAAHPMGPKAGAMSLRQAWEAIRNGESPAEAAARHPELAAALRAFGTQ
ncbi:MAG: ribulose 1,5-bisphosphate carboxylase [Deltaproteobacteria bacterium]|nr:ribulose 1,5-bisphosphate carboxylase [Deltaproteobacteria bacterium]